MREADGGALGLPGSAAQSIEYLDSDGARRDLGRSLARLFTYWEVPEAQQAELLELLPAKAARVLTGDEPLPLGEPLDRAGYLFGLYRLLASMFPENPELRSSWVRRRNRELGDVSPIELMTHGGLSGLKRVLELVEHQAHQ